MRARALIVALVAMTSAMTVDVAAANGRGGDDRDYVVVNPPLPPTDVGDQQSVVIQGELGGAGYIIETPPVGAWNGELVMWAHGYAGEGLELRVDPPGYGMRQHLLDLGYAWAASSYDANGYNIESGVRSTQELVREFRRLVGKPQRTYLAGASMGGHVTVRSIEQYPGLYDGALPLCGVVGDVELFDFFLDFHLAAQALAGIDASPTPPNYQSVVVPELKARLGIATGPPTNELGEQFRAIVIDRSGGERPGAAVAFESWKNFLFSLAEPDDGGPLSLNPGRVGTNVGTDYSPDAPVDIDEVIERVEPGDPRARRTGALGPIATVRGRPHVPVLSLHDLGDLFVPFSMEQEYARDVAANGREELLVQRAIRAIGHCEFSPAEVQTAFADLVTWVEDGVRPAGDDVLTPEVVADPDYGCQFSDPTGGPPGSRGAFAPCLP